MNGYISRHLIVEIVSEAIRDRSVLRVVYDHTDGEERVEHLISPFDIGTTNPRTYERNKNNLYAYSFTHLDDKTGLPDPKVCAFNVERFLSMEATGETFDENEIAELQRRKTGYDYRTCDFALLRDRDWFK